MLHNTHVCTPLLSPKKKIKTETPPLCFWENKISGKMKFQSNIRSRAQQPSVCLVLQALLLRCLWKRREVVLELHQWFRDQQDLWLSLPLMPPPTAINQVRTKVKPPPPGICHPPLKVPPHNSEVHWLLGPKLVFSFSLPFLVMPCC